MSCQDRLSSIYFPLDKEAMWETVKVKKDHQKTQEKEQRIEEKLKPDRKEAPKSDSKMHIKYEGELSLAVPAVLHIAIE